jgi:hypothetical protein
LNGDGNTPRRPPPLHSSTINAHQRHLTSTQTIGAEETSGGGGLLLRLQRRLQQLELENKSMSDEIDKGSMNLANKKSPSWHLDELEMDKLKNDLKTLREQILKGDDQATKEQLLGKRNHFFTELKLGFSFLSLSLSRS